MKKKLSILIGLCLACTSLTAFAKESVISDWTINKSGLYSYDVICDRENVSDGGSNSLRMYIEKEADNGYIEIRSTGVLPEKNTDYVLEFDYKSDSEDETIDTTVYAGNATRNFIASDKRTLSGGSEWMRYSAEFTTSTQAVVTVRIKLSENQTNLWVDNISLSKKDATENILFNPDMNTDLDVAPSGVSELTHSDVYADDITVSWVNPGDTDLDYIVVKDVLTDEETVFEKNVTSFVVEGAIRGREYCYKVMAVDVDGNYSEPAEISFIAEVLEFKIDEAVVTEADGKVKVSVSALNNKITEGKKITLVAFLYDGEILTDAQAIINVIPATSETVETELELTLPDGKSLSDCSVKTYVIESFESMQEV